MRSKFDERPLLDERLVIAVGEDAKRRLYELAAKQNVTASAIVRDALARYLARAA